MAEDRDLLDGSDLARIEPGDRLILARTIQARGPGGEAELKDRVLDGARFRGTCLGQAHYRHRSVFRNASEAAIWSHLELSYFRDVIPHGVLRELVIGSQPPEVQLRRAEILLTTRRPS